MSKTITADRQSAVYLAIVDRIERRLQPVIRERMAETPVLLLEGPRSVGKSTLLAEIATSTPHARSFDFDD